MKTLPVENGLIMGEQACSELLKQIAQAIGYMQERGILHRDLKLSNILIGADARTIKIIDFGLAV